jgi:2-keto-4-pentenoate hydratase
VFRADFDRLGAVTARVGHPREATA